jgi:hypothetical protein
MSKEGGGTHRCSCDERAWRLTPIWGRLFQSFREAAASSLAACSVYSADVRVWGAFCPFLSSRWFHVSLKPGGVGGQVPHNERGTCGWCPLWKCTQEGA